MENLGEGVCKEIEKIAASKLRLILNNIKELNESTNKQEFILALMTTKSIEEQDRCFNFDYWYQFSKSRSEAEVKAKNFEKVLRDDLNNFISIYESSENNFRKTIISLDDHEITNDIIKEMRLEALKLAKKAEMQADNLMIIMTNFHKSSNAKIKKIAKEFFLFFENAKGVLEQHSLFFL